MNERIEVMVKKKTPVGMKAAQYVLIALIVFLVLSSMVITVFGLLFAVAAGVAAYFLGLYSAVEYEYIYFDKELDEDVIYSMQKRKHLKTYDLTQLEVLAPVGSYHLDSYKNREVKVRDFSTHKAENEKNVYAMYLGGSEKVIFEPTSELVKTIANIAPRKVFTE